MKNAAIGHVAIGLYSAAIGHEPHVYVIIWPSMTFWFQYAIIIKSVDNFIRNTGPIHSNFHIS